ncbi:hypothetical protein PORY_002371 [Pneumocystis oryctolagi]|uniref:Uncharacterized protein n=1 Tax=Pneumocystis oryctolagi TaxID=42067 RepID=A0ACB7C9R8_9ASCO|nr:hypothetical protein PORY_002371 [Pneumocystis oryctolagi]
MDTSPLSAFCFSENSDLYKSMESISGHNKTDTSISVVFKKKNSNENGVSSAIDFKKNSEIDDNDSSFDAKTFKMSPMTSLAAEFSSNFYIDKSPVFPTPRRSLLLKFACEHQSTPPLDSSKDPNTPKFDSLVMDNINTTTPCPSSPIEVMDYSPLPHKQTVSVFNTRQCENLIDENSNLCEDNKTRDVDMISRTALSEITNYISSNNNMIDELSKEHLKATSFPDVIFDKENVDNNQVKDTDESCDIALNDLFTNSPNPLRFSLGNTVESDSSQSFTKPVFSRYSIALESSPLTFMNDNDVSYRASKWRRTQSLYQNSYDFFSAKHDGQNNNNNISLQSPSLEFNSNDCCILPCFSIKDDRLKRIDCDIFVKLLDGHYHDQCDEYIIVDCRFEYEYNGGHIIGSVNINTKDALDALLLDNPKTKKCLIVFHCEYSSHRAPRLALYLRNKDRQLNMQRYPHLYYPEIYILHGGYRSFYKKYKERCEPQNYVEMNDSLHKSACAKGMNNFRKNTKFLRTQTYTYGQVDTIHTNAMQKNIIK